MDNHVVRGALLSYRALFTWSNPLGYLSSRIVRPIGLTVTFGALSSHYGAVVGPTLIGASLLAGAHAVIYGMALSVGNERSYGTLDIWLASPQNKLGAVCQRALPHLVDAFISGMITYLACCALFGVLPLPAQTFAWLLVLSLISSFGYGTMVSGLSMTIKDVFVPPNLTYLTLMVLSGALVQADMLPGPVRSVSAVFPLSHVMQGIEEPDVLGAVGGEAAVGLLWFTVGALVIHRAVLHARR
ncbi:ABC transporter permease [Nonomuraea deserti]|uniref:ABC transporter permease n=1 Tax=Nonomuraea deserti TaxID=1848322 RepID=A0A4R4VWG2_9ACTN|nr:ABC transporter permease [Nonomuraea deserti]TDD07743.1 ABC transporter permease [Nonomuraea deserti]